MIPLYSPYLSYTQCTNIFLYQYIWLYANCSLTTEASILWMYHNGYANLIHFLFWTLDRSHFFIIISATGMLLFIGFRKQNLYILWINSLRCYYQGKEYACFFNFLQNWLLQRIKVLLFKLPMIMWDSVPIFQW